MDRLRAQVALDQVFVAQENQLRSREEPGLAGTPSTTPQVTQEEMAVYQSLDLVYQTCLNQGMTPVAAIQQMLLQVHPEFPQQTSQVITSARLKGIQEYL